MIRSSSSGRRRTHKSNAWGRRLSRFSRSFPRLLRTDFWTRSRSRTLWTSLFGAPGSKPRKSSSTVRRNRRYRKPQQLQMESLEARQLLSAVPITYVNDNWHFSTDSDNSGSLTVGDIVTNINDSVGTVTAPYGSVAFGTVTSGDFTGSLPGSATIQDAINNTTSTGTVHLSPGDASNYLTQAVNLGNTSITMQVDGTATIGSLAGGSGTAAVINQNSFLMTASTLTVGSDGTSTTFAGAISGTSGSLTKTGAGTLTLSHFNSYAGGTNINQGTLKITAGTPGTNFTTGNYSFTNGSPIISGLSSTSLLQVGQSVSGTGIPSNTVVQSIDSSSQVTLSQNVGAVSGTLSFAAGSAVGTTGTITVGAGTFELAGMSSVAALRRLR